MNNYEKELKEEKCRCNEGISNGREFDSNCPIHKNMEDAHEE